MTDKSAAAPQPPRKRSPPRPVEVVKVEKVLPRLVTVTFGGPALAGFGPARPSAHIKVLFPQNASWTPESNAPRPPSRTYTPRRFDAAANRLEVEFVLHGDGLASNWAERVDVGAKAWIGGPGGGLDIPSDLRHIVMAADETAMPAAGMILEALPEGCTPTVICEVEDGDDERPLSPLRSSAPVWLRRQPGGAAAGSLLEAHLRTLDAPADALWWVAAEAGAIRRIRQYLLFARGIDRRLIVTRGYWKAGASNHPDHDYGDDS